MPAKPNEAAETFGAHGDLVGPVPDLDDRSIQRGSLHRAEWFGARHATVCHYLYHTIAITFRSMPVICALPPEGPTEKAKMGIEHLAFRVIVRRATNGSVPFQWEVERDNAIAPVQVSTNRFRGMEDAYEAGKAWLNDFLSSRSSISNRQSIRLDVMESNDLDELDEGHISELEYEAE